MCDASKFVVKKRSHKQDVKYTTYRKLYRIFIFTHIRRAQNFVHDGTRNMVTQNFARWPHIQHGNINDDYVQSWLPNITRFALYGFTSLNVKQTIIFIHDTHYHHTQPIKVLFITASTSRLSYTLAKKKNISHPISWTIYGTTHYTKLLTNEKCV